MIFRIWFILIAVIALFFLQIEGRRKTTVARIIIIISFALHCYSATYQKIHKFASVASSTLKLKCDFKSQFVFISRVLKKALKAFKAQRHRGSLSFLRAFIVWGEKYFNLQEIYFAISASSSSFKFSRTRFSLILSFFLPVFLLSLSLRRHLPVILWCQST